MDFLKNNKLRVSFEDFADDSRKICELILDPTSMVSNEGRYVILRDVTKWDAPATTDILF